ncbi:class I SAM-dependent methyltransferase [Butyrivibrio fibrisolvens]|uniref:class I SAM-dependent methyltransferase n=1 Tax=Butyrivibrio fibrisolvens TaxID=831 RepID=UPI000400FF53|nr:class I SAM-dependent methyltransferase [Butyrivibrio fibrisolvens]
MNNIISESEMKFIGYYRLDIRGTKFVWNNRLFIKIYKNAEKFVRSLFESGLIDELTDKNLFVKTWISDLHFENCDLVLEQDYYPQSLGLEYWSNSMIVDAALTFAKAAEICIQYGFSIVDTHKNNILYVNNKFLICDIGAFDVEMNYGEYTPVIRNIKSNFLYPLLAGKKDLLGDETSYKVTCLDEEHRMRCAYPNVPYKIVKMILKYNGVCRETCKRNESEILSNNNFVKNVIVKLISIYTTKVYLNNKEHAKEKTIHELEKLSKDLNQYDLDNIDSTWSNYHKKMDINMPSERFMKIMNKIKNFNVTDSIELGGNSGFFSRLLLKNGAVKKAVVTDYDRGAIDKAYKETKKRNDNIITYRVDFNNISNETSQKLKSDILICLAMTHHLILAQGVDIDCMMETMRALTRKYIVVEFMPLGLWGGGELPEIPEWYTLDWFIQHFNKKFDMIEYFETEPNRIAIFGKVKE